MQLERTQTAMTIVVLMGIGRLRATSEHVSVPLSPKDATIGADFDQRIKMERYVH
jgi:hypothetical protein